MNEEDNKKNALWNNYSFLTTYEQKQSVWVKQLNPKL